MSVALDVQEGIGVCFVKHSLAYLPGMVYLLR